MSSILPLPHGVVGEFVGRAHMDLARVAELLGSYPTVVNSAFDWGNGDWETALGAASHSGRRDIAEFLISKGAKLDIFAAAFLGKLAVVRAILHETPAALRQPGPHGISLMDHAKKGGNPEVVAYLAHLLEPKGRSSEKPSRGKTPSLKNGKAKRRRAA